MRSNIQKWPGSEISCGRKSLSNNDASRVRERLLVSRRAEGVRISNRHSRGQEATKRRTRTGDHFVSAHRQIKTANQACFTKEGRQRSRTGLETQSPHRALHQQSRDEGLHCSAG